MKTRIISQFDTSAINEILKVILSGGVVAIPTDTVYGIACAVKDSRAIQSLYEIKKRENIKAIPVLLANLNQNDQIAKPLSENALILAKIFWPGALTIIVKKSDSIPDTLTIYETIGIRIPDHEWLRKLLRKAGPLATTSANLSGAASTATAQEVFDQLGGRIDLIVDGGKCKSGIASTVVDCSGSEIKILREGDIKSEQIIAALNNQDIGEKYE